MDMKLYYYEMQLSLDARIIALLQFYWLAGNWSMQFIIGNWVYSLSTQEKAQSFSLHSTPPPLMASNTALIIMILGGIGAVPVLLTLLTALSSYVKRRRGIQPGTPVHFNPADAAVPGAVGSERHAASQSIAIHSVVPIFDGDWKHDAAQDRKVSSGDKEAKTYASGGCGCRWMRRLWVLEWGSRVFFWRVCQTTIWLLRSDRRGMGNGCLLKDARCGIINVQAKGRSIYGVKYLYGWHYA
jgi:hypothetical protein